MAPIRGPRALSDDYLEGLAAAGPEPEGPGGGQPLAAARGEEPGRGGSATGVCVSGALSCLRRRQDFRCGEHAPIEQNSAPMRADTS